MSTSTLSIARRRTAWLARLNDYFELTKPKIAVLLLVTWSWPRTSLATACKAFSILGCVHVEATSFRSETIG